MTIMYQRDAATLSPERITEYRHPVYGDTTVFHDVVVASEIVQPYEDGRAWKPRDELEAYAWTIDGAWVVVGAHPAEGIVSDRRQVAGRTVNPRYVKDLNDPKTNRPCRAGVRADVEVFNSRVPKETLDDMKGGKKQDVSIGFFYTKDEKPGVVESDTCKGEKYDYVQRNMFHDHLAAGLDNGRCPMPYCGLGADELAKNLTGDPFAGFPSFNACVTHMMKPKSEGGEGYNEKQAKGTCGLLEKQHKAKRKKDSEVIDGMKKEIYRAILETLEALEGEREATKKTDKVEWWREVKWAEADSRTIFDALPEETRNLIIEAGLCPDCPENKKAEDMSLEDINEKITELQGRRKELKDKIDAYWKEWEEREREKAAKAAKEEVKPTESPTTKLWDEISEIDKELELYFNAKSFKIAIGDAVNDVDGYELDYLEADKQMTYAQKAALPDSDYAYIEEGCKKENGKTQQSCRHMPIHDEAHVRAALSALMGGRTGRKPPYADKAKPKVCAAAKKFKIESEVCGTEKKKKDADEDVLNRAKRVLG